VSAPTLISSDWANRIGSLIAAARNDLIICSPFISATGAELLRSCATSAFRLGGRLQIVTDLSPVNIYQTSTDPEAVLIAVDTFAPTTICHLPKLHAKVSVADADVAIITSANFTRGGLYRNHEYGIEITDRESAERIRADLTDYSRLAAIVPRDSVVRLRGYVPPCIRAAGSWLSSARKGTSQRSGMQSTPSCMNTASIPRRSTRGIFRRKS
jgi:phosphatidylserine/phosphatidylglycerophosphate/cardiolipin synthase-like enzyme